MEKTRFALKLRKSLKNFLSKFRFSNQISSELDFGLLKDKKFEKNKRSGGGGLTLLTDFFATFPFQFYKKKLLLHAQPATITTL